MTDEPLGITIRRVDAIRVALPMVKPMIMGGMHITDARNVLIRLELSDGTIGWGEATVAPTMTGDLVEGIVAAAAYLKPLLIGQDIAMHALLARQCLVSLHGNTGAKSAIDMALLDAAGRVMNVAVVDLLGGPVRRQVQSMWLLGNGSVEDDLAEAQAKQAQGLTLFKLKVGVKPVDAEIRSAHAMRDVLGPDTAICADANACFSPTAARRFLEQTKDCNLAYLEQPLRESEMEAATMLSRLGLVPICADESIIAADDILAGHRAGAMQGVNIKLMKACGPRAAMRMANLCEILGLSVTVAGKVAESCISTSQTLAVAAAAATVDWGVNLTHIYLAEDLVKTPLPLVDGGFAVPRGPGNGVDVDEAAVRRFTI